MLVAATHHRATLAVLHPHDQGSTDKEHSNDQHDRTIGHQAAQVSNDLSSAQSVNLSREGGSQSGREKRFHG